MLLLSSAAFFWWASRGVEGIGAGRGRAWPPVRIILGELTNFMG